MGFYQSLCLKDLVGVWGGEGSRRERRKEEGRGKEGREEKKKYWMCKQRQVHELQAQCHRITESQNFLHWKGPTRIFESNCWPCTGPSPCASGYYPKTSLTQASCCGHFLVELIPALNNPLGEEPCF